MNTLELYKSEYDIHTDRNGYAASIVGGEDHCFLCGNTDLESLVRHELFRGINRQKSKLFGLWVTVCPKCHETMHKQEDEYCKLGQILFEKRYPNADFLEIFGRNYR
jgi:hypothetical protein